MDRVLIGDDDIELCDLLKEFLQPEGFEVEAVHDGTTALARALSGTYALIILDIMIPEMNGLDVLRKIRARSSTPVLLLSARGAEIDRIVGLELGSDDYLAKPCNPRELLARIRAILRRANQEAKPDPAKLTVGDLHMDLGRRMVIRGHTLIELTAIEFNLLELLLRSAGSVVTRDQIVKTVLKRKFAAFDRSVDVHISKIRKKLCAGPKAEDPIRTLRGVGYIYTEARESNLTAE